MGKIKNPGLTLILFLWIGLLCAQENGDSSQTPVNLRPFQLTLACAHLLRDWYGTQSQLEEQGFTPTLSLVTDIAGNSIGGRDQGITHADNLGLDLPMHQSPASTPQDNATPNHFYIVGISVVAALGGFLFGFDSGVIN